MLDNIINIKLLNVVKTADEWEKLKDTIPLGMMCIEKHADSEEDTTVYFHDDQTVCSIAGREYTSRNNDPAWCFVMNMNSYGSLWTGPISISLTPEGVLWDAGGGSTGNAISFTYNGVTMYHSDTGFWMSGAYDDALENFTTVAAPYPLSDEWYCAFLESIIGPDPYNPKYITPNYTMKIKIGDGESSFSDLKYFTGDAESLCKLIYGRGMEIESGTDLNNITVQGQYFCTGGNASTLVNSPVTDKPFSIIVRELTTDDSSNIRQEIYLADDASTVLSRVKYNNTWGGWYTNQATPLT